MSRSSQPARPPGAALRDLIPADMAGFELVARTSPLTASSTATASWRMGDGDSELAIQGQNWLLENFRDARLMVPGHGSAQTPPFPMVAKTRDNMQRLRERIGAAIENGVSLQRAMENAEFEDWADTPLYEENHRTNANFVYRELEFSCSEKRL